jgi:hypothetical protein
VCPNDPLKIRRQVTVYSASGMNFCCTLVYLLIRDDLIQLMARREAAMRKDKEEAEKEEALARAAQDIIGSRATTYKP